MKRLIDDINQNSLIPGFEFTNIDQYDTVKPNYELISVRNKHRKQEYEELRQKFYLKNQEIKGIYKLYNSTIYLKSTLYFL